MSGLTQATTQKDQSGPNEANSPTSSAVERQRPQVAAAATAKARAALRRSQLAKNRGSATESMFTGDGPALASKYRSKSLVIVYYDSYVQSFFEEVVKFVSASRNLIRKAKMAAKVAQIKRMAELEMPDGESSEESDEGFGNGNAKFLPPQLSPSVLQPDRPAETNGDKINTVETGCDHSASKAKPANGNIYNIPTAATTPNRISIPQTNGNGNSIPSPLLPGPFRPSMVAWSSLSPHGRNSDTNQHPSILDGLDKSLESVQSLCEHAAHQFLRDGDCLDEIVSIKDRLTETKTTADKELQCMLESDADGKLKKLLAEGGPLRNRTYRPQIMRRDMASTGPASSRLKTCFAGGGGENANATVNLSAGGAGFEVGAGPALEVDEGFGGNGADIKKEPPKFGTRSTCAMDPQVVDGL